MCRYTLDVVPGILRDHSVSTQDVVFHLALYCSSIFALHSKNKCSHVQIGVCLQNTFPSIMRQSFTDGLGSM
jgi:hypothetical protein